MARAKSFGRMDVGLLADPVLDDRVYPEQISAEVGNDDVFARGVDDCLVRVRRGLAIGYGAGLFEFVCELLKVGETALAI